MLQSSCDNVIVLNISCESQKSPTSLCESIPVGGTQATAQAINVAWKWFNAQLLGKKGDTLPLVPKHAITQGTHRGQFKWHCIAFSLLFLLFELLSVLATKALKAVHLHFFFFFFYDRPSKIKHPRTHSDVCPHTPTHTHRDKHTRIHEHTVLFVLKGEPSRGAVSGLHSTSSDLDAVALP